MIVSVISKSQPHFFLSDMPTAFLPYHYCIVLCDLFVADDVLIFLKASKKVQKKVVYLRTVNIAYFSVSERLCTLFFGRNYGFNVLRFDKQ